VSGRRCRSVRTGRESFPERLPYELNHLVLTGTLLEKPHGARSPRGDAVTMLRLGFPVRDPERPEAYATSDRWPPVGSWTSATGPPIASSTTKSSPKPSRRRAGAALGKLPRDHRGNLCEAKLVERGLPAVASAIDAAVLRRPGLNAF
jgi:hypothetical protein